MFLKGTELLVGRASIWKTHVLERLALHGRARILEGLASCMGPNSTAYILEGLTHHGTDQLHIMEEINSTSWKRSFSGRASTQPKLA